MFSWAALILFTWAFQKLNVHISYLGKICTHACSRCGMVSCFFTYRYLVPTIWSQHFHKDVSGYSWQSKALKLKQNTSHGSQTGRGWRPFAAWIYTFTSELLSFEIYCHLHRLIKLLAFLHGFLWCLCFFWLMALFLNKNLLAFSLLLLHLFRVLYMKGYEENWLRIIVACCQYRRYKRQRKMLRCKRPFHYWIILPLNPQVRILCSWVKNAE